MDEESFRRFMKRNSKSESTIREALINWRSFGGHMEEGGASIDAATEKNLEEYASNVADERVIRNMMHSLHYCFKFVGRQSMEKKCIEIRSRYLKREPLRLKDFLGVSTEVIGKLKDAALRNIDQLLEAGRTDKLRRGLSQELGIPLDVVVELVKMSDLARIFGLKAIRARLYHDAGVDTVEKMSLMNPAELIRVTSDYIKRSNFNGIPPTPKEAEFTINEAKKMARLVVW